MHFLGTKEVLLHPFSLLFFFLLFLVLKDFIPSLAWLNNINGLNSGVEKVFQELDHFLNEVIDDHMARLERKNADMRARKEDQTDFVDVLLEIQKDNTDGVSVGRESIKALIL
ncbi:hypothetical protein RJ641_014291, partial [Dillenia turbinata]